MSAEQLIAHALDLFAPLGPGVAARRMFGGVGFWMRGRFFAVGDPDEGALFLKVDEQTRETFLTAGGRPFTYRAKDGGVLVMSYVTPPDAALEDPEAMLPWALLALEAAGRAAAGKRPRRKPKAAAVVAAPKRKASPKPAPRASTRRASKRR
jgi:DNA transformation protein